MAEEKNNKKTDWFFLILVILVLAFFIGRANIGELYDELNPPPIVKPLSLADVELMMFNPLSNNTSMNVELWLVNIGETPATNITVYIRVRNQNGTILQDSFITPSATLLRDNESCTAEYTIEYTEVTTYHTIEISWIEGRKTYLRTI